jgi:hypothetical protein
MLIENPLAALFALLDGKREKEERSLLLSQSGAPPPPHPRSLACVSVSGGPTCASIAIPHSSGGIRPGGGAGFRSLAVLSHQGGQGAISSPNIPSDRNPAKYRLWRVKERRTAYPVGLSGRGEARRGRAGRHNCRFCFLLCVREVVRAKRRLLGEKKGGWSIGKKWGYLVLHAYVCVCVCVCRRAPFAF